VILGIGEQPQMPETERGGTVPPIQVQMQMQFAHQRRLHEIDVAAGIVQTFAPAHMEQLAPPERAAYTAALQAITRTMYEGI